MTRRRPEIQHHVKICCIESIEEANMAINAGARALGLVSNMPSGPGVIDEVEIREIARAVPADVDTFLLTSRQDTRGIVEQHQRCETTTVQFVDHVPFDVLRQVREQLPGIQLVQVIHIEGPEAIDMAMAVAPLVDALLLDSGKTGGAIKLLGGTGDVHDWSISAAICARCPVPVFLAGGLNADNVQAAIETVRPFGVDLCSRVRTDGALDANKLVSFFKALYF